MLFLGAANRLRDPAGIGGCGFPGPVEALWEDMSHINGIALDAVRGIVYVGRGGAHLCGASGLCLAMWGLPGSEGLPRGSARNMDTAFALERHSGRLQWSVGRYGSIPSFDAMVQCARVLCMRVCVRMCVGVCARVRMHLDRACGDHGYVFFVCPQWLWRFFPPHSPPFLYVQNKIMSGSHPL